MAKSRSSKIYLHPALTKAIDILELLEQQQEPMSLSTIYPRVRASKTTVYRLLQTYVQRGYLALDNNGLYRIAKRQKRLRFGFAGESADMPFSEAVTESLKAAAASFGIDLLVLDNHYDAETAVANADRFLREQIDLVIEFQIEQSVAGSIADKISGAGIPIIAVDIPHPHAIYFGADNYRTGFAAGELLVKHAVEHWDSKVSWVLGLDLQQAGPFVQNRTNGAFDAVRAGLPGLKRSNFVRVDSRGLRERGARLVHNFFRQHPHAKSVLIAAHNDTVALGALQALRDLKKEKAAVIVGHDCIPEALGELEVSKSAFIGSVANPTEPYGVKIITLALAMLGGQVVAPYNFTEFKVVSGAALNAK